jgi:hypothetical protein
MSNKYKNHKIRAKKMLKKMDDIESILEQNEDEEILLSSIK